MMNLKITDAVKHLIIINVLFFVGSYIYGSIANDFLALHSVLSDKFQYWQLVTHMFMHGNIMHIFFNMFALYSFGIVLEQMWGTKKFLFFYLSSGIGAAMFHLGINYIEIQNLLENTSALNLSKEITYQILNASVSDNTHYRPDLFIGDLSEILKNSGKIGLIDESIFAALFDSAKLTQIPMVGASGAIYGILAAFAFTFPNAELMLLFIPVPVKAKYFVPGLLAVDLFLGLKGTPIFGSGGDGIAHFAHLGGALIGFVMMWYWNKNQFNSNRWN